MNVLSCTAFHVTLTLTLTASKSSCHPLFLRVPCDCDGTGMYGVFYSAHQTDNMLIAGDFLYQRGVGRTSVSRHTFDMILPKHGAMTLRK